ncbi:MAG: FtsX-like permease family protein [Bacteroidia bacterium]|nr:MAG: FtsX-like permease family protein [Bacteroidia bacterium]
MFRNFLTNASRNMKKQSGYVMLNMAGLVIGITSFLFISLYVVHELSYDRFHRNYENIYRLKVIGQMSGGELDQANTAAPMAQAMLNDYPEVIGVTRARGMGDWLIGYGENKFNEEHVLFVDSTFFDVLDFRMLKGDPKTALVRPRSMVMTEEYATKYFGNADPVGQKVTVESDTVLYTVTGVVQNVPDNSHIKFDILASLSTYPNQANSQFWVSHNFYTYIEVSKGTQKEALQEKLQEMVIKYVGPQLQEILGQSIDDFRNAGNDFSYVMEPLKDIHLKGAKQYYLEPSGSLSTVYIFSVIAFLILVIAIINYVNLATAKSAGRAKEVGVKKVSGASKAGLMSQFIGESVIIAAVAVIISVLLVFALTPAFSQLTGKTLSVDLWNVNGLLFLIMLIIVVGFSAGFYPALILASFDPVEVLKGTLSPGSMSKRLRGILVVFQFAVSIVIIIGSIVVYKQLNFMTKKDLGFDKENLIVIRRSDAFWRQREAFREQILKIEGVEKAGFSTQIPGMDYSNNAFFRDQDPEKNTYLLQQSQVSFDFPQTLGVRLLDGRFFSREYGTDSTAILINEAAVKSLGLKEPVVGQYIQQPSGPNTFQRSKIIGVMKDFNIASIHKAIDPVCFTVLFPGGGDQFATIRLSGQNIPATIRAIEEKWKEFTPDQPFQFDFFADSWNNLYSAEMKTGKIFILFSLLAIFIACLGLIGLVAFMTNKRTREIGIRKTYGASISTVLRLLVMETVILILISSLIAWPVAYFGSKYWMEGFADKAAISPLIYILATLAVITVGFASVIYQTLKAANYSPAHALRIE